MGMGEKNYRIVGMTDYFARYEFPKNVDIDFTSPVESITFKIMAEVTDLKDKAMVDAIIKTCESEGVSELYLLDKKFILEAINEKLEREAIAAAI